MSAAVGKTKLDSGWLAARSTEVTATGVQLTTTMPPGGVEAPWIEADVPGTILSTLVKSKSIPDPFYGLNNKSILDIADSGRDYYTFWFFTSFGCKLSSNQHASLNFRAINYSGEVYLNGNKRILPKGMFRRHSLDVTDIIHPDGKNLLAVIIYPPDHPGRIPPEGGQGGDHEIGKDVATQYVEGWDWIAPIRDRNTGIWDEVSLSITGPVKIIDPHLVSTFYDDFKRSYLHATIELENKSSWVAECSLNLQVTTEVEGNICLVEHHQSYDVSIQPGKVLQYTVPPIFFYKPNLWWPNGMGKQSLYDVLITVDVKGFGESDSWTHRFGFRKIESEIDAATGGRLFKVNGQPIFIRGGNWILSDGLLRLSDKRYKADIKFHADMNFNMIRCWGGGISERPEFYNYCDIYGILVWQEFWITGDVDGRGVPVSNPNGPLDHDLFMLCARDTIKLLRNHASLALWVGGNEQIPPPDLNNNLKNVLTLHPSFSNSSHKGLPLQESTDPNGPEYQKQVSVCFRTMSSCFSDHMKAEEGFHKLDQLKDTKIMKMLKSLLDPSASFAQMWSFRVELFKIIGEQNMLHDFIKLLAIKCSHHLFNKEFLKEIFVEVSAQESACNAKFVSMCMSLLEMIASNSPDLLSGFEENLVNMLKENNDIVKEGVAHLLAIAGGNIREQLAATSSSVDLLLERLCLEGTRKQAKYSVQALTAITEDDGLKSLSVLYKGIVDMLDDKTHMPALLQSLGCIAQFAMPIYETREEEIYEFIKHKILEVNDKTERSSANDSESKGLSEHCMLKIFSIKTLVKSYLPIRDAHLRLGIEKIIEILKNVLSFGNVLKDIKSSVADKEHMKVASAKAILRLSRQWDHMIPLDVFYKILRVVEDTDDQSRKTFIQKVQRYIVEHQLDAKYVLTFLLNIREYPSPDYEEGKHHLLETIKNCQQPKIGQSLMRSDGNSTFHYLEYSLVYLVHALAHHPSFDKFNNVNQFEPIYWQLHLFLSVLLNKDGEPNLRKNCTKILSIFRSIKLSEDAFDKTKSKVSHVICDLGLLIVQRLVSNQSDISNTSNIMSLPPNLYKPIETTEGEQSLVNGEKSWFSAECILAHFESLNFQIERPRVSDEQKDEMSLDNSGTKGNEVSMGNMMKSIKSKGSKEKKRSEKKVSPSNMEVPDKDVDILGVVREINMDMNNDKRIEFGEITRRKPILTDQLSNRNNGNEENLTSPTRKETNGIAFLPGPSTPKRKRSASMQRLQSKVIEGQKEVQLLTYSRSNKKNSSSGKKITREQDSVSMVPDLVSHLPTIKRSSKDDDVMPNKRKNIDDSKSPASSSKKRKLSCASSLAKCSLSDSPSKYEELVGSRIKVWWPLDKAYYEGVIHSYDKGKKKYKILYDDGDTEILNLDKEKWKLATDDKPRKQSKLQYSSSKSSDKEMSQKKRSLTKLNKSKKRLQSENGNDSGGSDASSGGNSEPYQEDKQDTSTSDSKNSSDYGKS